MSEGDRETIRNIWLSWKQEPSTLVSELKLPPVNNELVDNIIKDVKNKNLSQFDFFALTF